MEETNMDAFGPENVVDVDTAAPESEDSSTGPATEKEVEATITRLAGLSQVAYELARKDECKRLGVRPTILDKLVAAERPKDDDQDDGGLGLVDPEPWPEEVDGAALLEEVAAGLRRYVVMPAHAIEATALWVVHCFTFECWQHTPRLGVTAPEKGCGKSTLLDVLSMLTPRAVKTENMSTAVMFRLMDAHRPTLLVDEMDTFLVGKDVNEDLRGALNAGHAKGGRHLRCQGDNHDLKGFKTFGPVALAGIGRLPSTLADRSIPIVLHRRGPDDLIDNFRSDRADHLRETARKAARWAQDNEGRLKHGDPTMPDGIDNRAADNWRSLLSIADAVGGRWPDLARLAAMSLAGANMENESIGVRLLSDMRDIFKTVGDDRITSKDLAEKLHEIEDAPWPEYGRGQKPITPVQIARLLKSYSIAPCTIRTSYGTPKGYRLKGPLKTAFALYLPQQGPTPTQTSNSAGYSDLQNATQTPDVADRKFENARVSGGCGDVAAQNGSKGAAHTVAAPGEDSGPETGDPGAWDSSL